MEEEVNKEYMINISMSHTGGNSYKTANSAVNYHSRQFFIHLNEEVYKLLNKPKELSFILDSKGKPKLRYCDIDTRARNKVLTSKSWGENRRISIGAIDEHLLGKYCIEVEGDDIILTKVEDEN